MKIKALSATFMDMRDAINAINDAHTLFVDALERLYNGEIPAEVDNAQADALCAYENALQTLTMAAIQADAERSANVEN